MSVGMDCQRAYASLAYYHLVIKWIYRYLLSYSNGAITSGSKPDVFAPEFNGSGHNDAAQSAALKAAARSLYLWSGLFLVGGDAGDGVAVIPVVLLHLRGDAHDLDHVVNGRLQLHGDWYSYGSSKASLAFSYYCCSRSGPLR